MKKSPILLLFIFLFFSCVSEQKADERNTYQILSLLIDEFGKPTIPPRELYGKESFTKKQEDSLLNQQENISIYPVILKNSDTKFRYKEEYDKEFNNLIKTLNVSNEEKIINISKIKIKRPYRLSIIDTIKMKNDQRYLQKNFDKLISFHFISFNSNFTKAVTIIGIGTGPLNAFSSLVFLKKTNNEWHIIGSDTFSIS